MTHGQKTTDLNKLYTMWNASSIGRKGGGIVLVVAKRCRVTNVRRGILVSTQFIATSVKLGVNIEIWGIYHSPYSKGAPITNTTFLDEISKFMNDILHTNKLFNHG